MSNPKYEGNLGIAGITGVTGIPGIAGNPGIAAGLVGNPACDNCPVSAVSPPDTPPDANAASIAGIRPVIESTPIELATPVNDLACSANVEADNDIPFVEAVVAVFIKLVNPCVPGIVLVAPLALSRTVEIEFSPPGNDAIPLATVALIPVLVANGPINFDASANIAVADTGVEPAAACAIAVSPGLPLGLPIFCASSADFFAISNRFCGIPGVNPLSDLAIASNASAAAPLDAVARLDKPMPILPTAAVIDPVPPVTVLANCAEKLPDLIALVTSFPGPPKLAAALSKAPPALAAAVFMASIVSLLPTVAPDIITPAIAPGASLPVSNPALVNEV